MPKNTITVSITGNKPAGAVSAKKNSGKRFRGCATLSVSGILGGGTSFLIYSKRTFATLKGARKWAERLNTITRPAE